MYGLVNQAISDLVVAKFGMDSWLNICDRVGFKERTFISHQPYEDSLTYELVAAISSEHQIEAKDILISFGEFWVMETAAKKYTNLFLSSGNGFVEFLEYLPNFHSKVMMVFKDIEPPEFSVKKVSPLTYEVHYSSTRKGLGYFVLGLLRGLGNFFNKPIEIVGHGLDENNCYYMFEIKMLE